jgi:hypothetical protein
MQMVPLLAGTPAGPQTLRIKYVKSANCSTTSVTVNVFQAVDAIDDFTAVPYTGEMEEPLHQY